MGALKKIQDKKSWALALTITFSDEEALQQFEKAFQPLWEACRDKEPLCLAYQWMRSDKEDQPLTGMLFERYVKDGDSDGHKFHMEQEHFQTFRNGVYGQLRKDGRATVVGGSFHLSSMGFM